MIPASNSIAQRSQKATRIYMMLTLRNLLVFSAIPLQISLAASGDLLWRDDFDENTLNTNYWSYDLGGGGWGNSELQTYTTGAVSVGGGLLNIRAERISTGFTSGRIKTDGKVLFRYGTVEARIKIPDVDEGLWPAFWTLGQDFDDIGWPRAGEIDIMEIGQGLAITENVVNRRVISGAHWEFEDRLAAYALWKTFNVDLNDAYHIYKLEWTPTSLSTYVDNIKVWEMDIDAANCVDCEEFHKPHFLLLNLAVGGFFTSTGGSGSSGYSSSSACASSASSSSSSGGCGEARTDVDAPLPANMLVDWVQILDNGFAQIFPTGAPTPNPSSTRSGAISTKAPSPPPTYFPTDMARALSTKAPTKGPTNPPTPRPTPRPTPGPTLFRSGALSTKSPSRHPTPSPVRPTGGGKSGKGKGSSKGSGKSGKGSKGGKSGSKGGKSGKGSKSGKSGSKGSKKSSSYTTLSSRYASDASDLPKTRAVSVFVTLMLALVAA